MADVSAALSRWAAKDEPVEVGSNTSVRTTIAKPPVGSGSSKSLPRVGPRDTGDSPSGSGSGKSGDDSRRIGPPASKSDVPLRRHERTHDTISNSNQAETTHKGIGSDVGSKSDRRTSGKRALPMAKVLESNDESSNESGVVELGIEVEPANYPSSRRGGSSKAQPRKLLPELPLAAWIAVGVSGGVLILGTLVWALWPSSSSAPTNSSDQPTTNASNLSTSGGAKTAPRTKPGAPPSKAPESTNSKEVDPATKSATPSTKPATASKPTTSTTKPSTPPKTNTKPNKPKSSARDTSQIKGTYQDFFG